MIIDRRIWHRYLQHWARKSNPAGHSDELAKLSQAVNTLAEQPVFTQSSLSPADRILREQAELRISAAADRLAELDARKLVFESTETWRVVYEQVLKSVKAQRYLSVAVIRSEDYWRDKPGRESMAFNFNLIKHGFHIHRIFIIDDFFWAPTVSHPIVQLYDWITDQASYGLEISLVRKSALENEPNLICDFGIYGDEVVGTQESDFQGKTTRYEICFDQKSVKEAEDRWRKLLLFVAPLDSR